MDNAPSNNEASIGTSALEDAKKTGSDPNYYPNYFRTENGMQTTGMILGKAHRLCEWLRSNDGDLSLAYESSPIVLALERSVKWHVGNAVDLPAPNSRNAFDSIPLRLPAKEMLIEFEIEMRMADGRIVQMTGFLLCANHVEEVIDFLAFGQADGRFFFDGGGELFCEDGIRKFAVYKDFEYGKTELHRLSNIIEQTLLALHCTNVRSVDNAPPAALNKKRQKASKLPLFTYKTLHIISGERSRPHSQNDDDEVARQGPRLHFRRGHVREISEGRITWVQQCMVGNRRIGVVKKAYALESKKRLPPETAL